MSDLRTALFAPLTPGGLPSFDWSRAGSQLEIDDGLDTAIILSLFSDRRAAEDDVIPDGTDDRRGWWADAYPEIDADRIGSRLWLLHREKDTAAVVQRAREYCEEALAWLIEDGVASRVVVETGWVDRVSRSITPTKTLASEAGLLGMGITIVRTGQPVSRFRFEQFWEGA
jgi:phage gp46-like protein